MDSGLHGLLNACHQVTITHQHTDATDSPMFNLAPMLPISDVRIGLTVASTVHRTLFIAINSDSHITNPIPNPNFVFIFVHSRSRLGNRAISHSGVGGSV